MTAQLTPILQAASDVLNVLPGKQAHVREIADEAVKRNLTFQMSADEFVGKLSQALAAHVKTKQPLFTKVPNKAADGSIKSYRKGVYRLKRLVMQRADEVHVAPEVSTAFTGKAGEHAVMSELLFWGFNASLMAVDTGIDIVATKDNVYFHLQVKTATQRADGRFAFSIKTAAFDANDRATTYYVFLMRYPNGNVYAVLPSSHLMMKRKLGIIKDGDSLSFTITSDPKGKTYTLNGGEITPFINAFGVIR